MDLIVENDKWGFDQVADQLISPWKMTIWLQTWGVNEPSTKNKVMGVLNQTLDRRISLIFMRYDHGISKQIGALSSPPGGQ